MSMPMRDSFKRLYYFAFCRESLVTCTKEHLVKGTKEQTKALNTYEDRHLLLSKLFKITASFCFIISSNL